MDATNVCVEYVQIPRVFGTSEVGHSGYRLAPAKNSGIHFTAVVIANAAGDVLSPFFILASVMQMRHWLHPLSN